MGSNRKPDQKTVDPFSLSSLLLKCYWKGRVFSNATGFIVTRHNRAFLFTNWHVLSGRDPDTGQPILPGGIEPDEIGIMHHVSGLRSEWEERREILRDEQGNTKCTGSA